jgi:hypothetical protein
MRGAPAICWRRRTAARFGFAGLGFLRTRLKLATLDCQRTARLRRAQAAAAWQGRPHLPLCVLLEDRNAGILADWCVGWFPKATFKTGFEGRWNGNERKTILGTGLTWKQNRRAARIAVERGALEMAVGWYAGKRMAYTPARWSHTESARCFRNWIISNSGNAMH